MSSLFAPSWQQGIGANHLGALLRGKRKERHISLAQIAQDTRIPLSTLKYLEAGAYDRLPGHTFVKGFLRSYCRCLGIAEEPILTRYLRISSASPRAASTRTNLREFKRSRPFGGLFAMLILSIFLGLMVSMLLKPRPTAGPVQLSTLDPWQLVHSEAVFSPRPVYSGRSSTAITTSS